MCSCFSTPKRCAATAARSATTTFTGRWSPKASARTPRWFEATVEEVQAAIVAVRNGHAARQHPHRRLRDAPEQEEAVAVTAGYFRSHAEDAHAPRFLWNARDAVPVRPSPAYQLAPRDRLEPVLVLTYKPVVQNRLEEDSTTLTSRAGGFVDQSPHRRSPRHAARTPRIRWWFGVVSGHARQDRRTGRIQRAQRVIAPPSSGTPSSSTSTTSGRGTTRPRALTRPESGDRPRPRSLRSVTEDDTSAWPAPPPVPVRNLRFRRSAAEFTEDQIFNWTTTSSPNGAKEHWDGAAGPRPLPRPARDADLLHQHRRRRPRTGAADSLARVPAAELPQRIRPRPRNSARSRGATGPGAYQFRGPRRGARVLECCCLRLPSDDCRSSAAEAVQSRKVFTPGRRTPSGINDVAGCFADAATPVGLLLHLRGRRSPPVAASGCGRGRQASRCADISTARPASSAGPSP